MSSMTPRPPGHLARPRCIKCKGFFTADDSRGNLTSGYHKRCHALILCDEMRAKKGLGPTPKTGGELLFRTWWVNSLPIQACHTATDLHAFRKWETFSPAARAPWRAAALAHRQYLKRKYSDREPE